MTNIDRLAVIASLSQTSQNLGRTALMKYCYFLQTVRAVPLGYRFSLYSYGPFDSDVLADLDTAESLDAVKSSVVYFPGGYGYNITPGVSVERLTVLGSNFLQAHQHDLEWLQNEFGSWSPADLEVGSTLVYSDREAADRGQGLALKQLALIVNELKPKYPVGKILELAERLHDRGMFTSTSK